MFQVFSQKKEPDDQTVQALRAGENLKNETLGEVLGSLGEQAGGGLTHDAGTLGGTYAAQTDGQSGAQKGKTDTAKRFKERTDSKGGKRQKQKTHTEKAADT